ncbi:helix-turn-helix domain-containing protein [Euzebya tangerina]|uniref:helix-turn-helix domain-containing protein n=1 Tax=Euzebya tangerina TaxID=591198 RepID=UPI000E316283|nr:helix-turn-helix domain-containing protein [Euzebya tangerina]
MEQGPPASRTLDRGIRVVEAIAAAGDGATVAELSRFTGLDRAVIARLLDTLSDRCWLVRGPGDQRYRLGPTLLALVGSDPT